MNLAPNPPPSARLNYIKAVGLIVRIAEGDETRRLVDLPKAASFLGSCFAFRRAEFFLTAAHVLRGYQLGELRVICAADRQLYRIRTIETHPRADVALAVLSDAPQTDPFWNVVSPHLGEDFIAYGYPEDPFPGLGLVPTPRIFKGHIQRHIRNYKSDSTRYEYDAIELSMPCPPGLSGGPCFKPSSPMTIVGIVTENVDTTKVLDTVEETAGPGYREITKLMSVVRYGVGIDPAGIAEWLDRCVPPRRTG